MGYLFLSLSLLSGMIKGYCGKKTSGFVTRYRDSMTVNLIRMLLCIAIGFPVLLLQGGIGDLRMSGFSIFLAAVAGVTTSVFVTTWLLSVRKGAYMLVDIFLMLGVVVTIVCSCTVLGETISLRQIIGLAVLTVAVMLMCSYQRATKGKLTVGALILLTVCGVANGLTDFSQKWFVRTVENGSVAAFQLYTYLFSALTLFVILAVTALRERGDRSEEKGAKFKIPAVMIVYIVIMAACLYLNSYAKTRAAVYLPASQLYPLNQGGSLVLSTAMAAICFREKPNATGILGVILAFVALLLINL